MFKRVLIKLSGEALAGDENNHKIYDGEIVRSIVEDIKEVKNKGTDVMLVVGGGNIWRGRTAPPYMDDAKADSIGMLATVMNAIYLSEAFRDAGIKSAIMTPITISGTTKRYMQDDALSYIEKGYVLIFAGGLGHPFFSTDTIAAVRAAELYCDCVLYAKTIDGVYDADPRKNENAVKYNTITYKEIIKRGLKFADISAMDICNNKKIRSVAFLLSAEKSIVIACNDDEELYKIGTKVNFG